LPWSDGLDLDKPLRRPREGSPRARHGPAGGVGAVCGRGPGADMRVNPLRGRHVHLRIPNILPRKGLRVRRASRRGVLAKRDMVRGLAIRRIFILVDLALAAATLATAGMLVMRVVRPPAAPGSVETDRGAGAETSRPMMLPEVGPLATYDVITKYRLFGDAGSYDPTATPPPPPPEPVQEEVPDTDLNLRLMGTIALSAKDPFASAFIQNMDQRGLVESFLLGEAVVENVTLEEVHKRQVILMNKRKTPAQQERLRMDEGEEGSTFAAPVTVAQTDFSDRSTARVMVSKAELRNELMTNGADLLKIKPVLKKDAAGNVIGVTADEISKYPLAQKLGLQDGDVLQTVNNEPIDSQAKILEIINKHQNASSFRIGILRDGRPRIVTYNLR